MRPQFKFARVAYGSVANFFWMAGSGQLIQDLAVDPLDTVVLVMSLEEELGMEIPDQDAEKLKSIEDVIDYIRKHKKK